MSDNPDVAELGRRCWRLIFQRYRFTSAPVNVVQVDVGPVEIQYLRRDPAIQEMTIFLHTSPMDRRALTVFVFRDGKLASLFDPLPNTVPGQRITTALVHLRTAQVLDDLADV